MNLFKKATPTPTQRLTSALSALDATLDAVQDARNALADEQAELVQRLAAVSEDVEQASTVATNLAELLGK